MYQFNIFIDTMCASWVVVVGTGGIAAIYFASRLVQFPMGVFAYSLSSASLPSLSASANDKDLIAFKQTLYFSLKNLLFVLLPCAVMLAILSPLLVQVLFQHGAFDSYSADITSSALLYLSLGLPFFGATRILVSGYYAMQDTQTPVKIATVCLLINAVLNVLLMFPLKIGGITLASSVAGFANFIMLLTTMNERLGGSKGIIKKFFLRLTPSLMLMATVMYLAQSFLHPKGFIKLVVVSFLGVISYLGCCHFTKVPEYLPIWKTLKKKITSYFR